MIRGLTFSQFMNITDRKNHIYFFIYTSEKNQKAFIKSGGAVYHMIQDGDFRVIMKELEELFRRSLIQSKEVYLVFDTTDLNELAEIHTFLGFYNLMTSEQFTIPVIMLNAKVLATLFEELHNYAYTKLQFLKNMQLSRNSNNYRYFKQIYG